MTRRISTYMTICIIIWFCMTPMCNMFVRVLECAVCACHKFCVRALHSQNRIARTATNDRNDTHVSTEEKRREKKTKTHALFNDNQPNIHINIYSYVILQYIVLVLIFFLSLLFSLLCHILGDFNVNV